MTLTESQINFANKIHIALYGESIKEKVLKEVAMEKTISVQKLIRKSDLSDDNIAEIFNISAEFVAKIRKSMD